MKNFFRSVRYLWPYRFRLAMSMLCVLGISILWGGGLGMLVPGSKILISEEGLHGWAYGSIAGDRLDARLVQRTTPTGTRIGGRDVVEILDILEVSPGGRAERAGIRAGDWLLGMYGPDGKAETMPGRRLVRELAQSRPGRRVALCVYDPSKRTERRVGVELGSVGAPSRLLGRIAAAIPEPRDRPGRYRMFLGVLVIVLIATFMRDFLRFGQEYLVATAVNRAIMDIRCENYEVVLHLPTTYFSEQGITDTMSRFVADTSELRRGQITLFGKTMAEPGKAVASLIAALIISWKLTLLALLVGPPAYWLIRRFGKRMKRAAKKMLEAWSEMITVLEETLGGIRVVKAYTMEGAERKRFFQVNRRLLKQLNRIEKIDAATAPTIEALGITAACCGGAIAGYWALSYQISTDRFIALMGCMASMFDPLRKLAKVVTRFQRADAAASRVFELHDRVQQRSPRGAPSLPRHSRSVEFRNVGFRYPGASEDALKDINLTIDFGRTVAIVGPNGSGKTTLLSLLPRLIDPTAGQVLIDGVDISTVSLRSLRRQIGLVTQEIVLFRATIAENIAYGMRRPKPAAVLEAAKKAFVDEFVRDLPDGYDTMVGQRGATLSGGQGQRITIARAILRDPAILIFDEAMSQVDADSENRIHQAIEEFCRGRTTLVIAHRFQTVMSADMIVVMDAGRIVDVGPHAELIGRCRLYRHLYNTQLAGSADPHAAPGGQGSQPPGAAWGSAEPASCVL
ncbi:MAG: ATP-binding cassette domain-containing protein, partial [Planctomycetes bacterium]|nr:ATP-binding cassette domain-containing protein [Planctomycetota bacterium]